MDDRALSLLSRTPLEKIERVCVYATVMNAEKLLKDRKMLVVLACGHYAYTRAANRARCLRCKEMLRRSLLDGSENYIAVREGEQVDNMDWEADPCRGYNEPESTRWNLTESKGGAPE